VPSRTLSRRCCARTCRRRCWSACGVPEARHTPLTSGDQRLRRSGVIVAVRNARHPQGRAVIRFDLKPGFGHDEAAPRELRTRCCHAAYLGTTLGAPSKGHEGERPGGREALPSERKHVRSHQTPPDTTRSREAEWRR
jgi:hypothetical protein